MSFFKAYDMRGEFGREFTLDTVHRIGRWLPHVLRQEHTRAAPLRVLVGRDARLTSGEIRNELCRGLLESGCLVDDMGLATTPMVYFFTADKGYDVSVQITASHNPASHNGMKVSRAGALPVGYDSGLAVLEAKVESGALPPLAATMGQLQQVDYLAEFIEWLRARKANLDGLRYAIDCSDGMAGLFVHQLFGAAPIYLNDKPDGHFPHHSPNPLEAASRAQLSRAVQEHGLDIGIIFDGDADRVMFVDEQGAFVQPDYLIPMIARHFLAQEPGAPVIHDVRTSRGAIEALVADGAKPVMGKVGHAFAKLLLRTSGAVCGGELAGHYYFRDFFCCDSAEWAALLVLEAAVVAKRQGVTFSQLVAPIRKYTTTGELNYKIERKDEAIAAVLAAATVFGVPQASSEIDGVRIDYQECWFSIRKSNTEPYLRLIVEARNADRLASCLQVLERALEPFL